MTAKGMPPEEWLRLGEEPDDTQRKHLEFWHCDYCHKGLIASELHDMTNHKIQCWNCFETRSGYQWDYDNAKSTLRKIARIWNGNLDECGFMGMIHFNVHALDAAYRDFQREQASLSLWQANQGGYGDGAL